MNERFKLWEVNGGSFKTSISGHPHLAWEVVSPQSNGGVCVVICPREDFNAVTSAEREATARFIAAAPDGYALAEEIVNHLYLTHDIARVRQMAKDFIAKAVKQ